MEVKQKKIENFFRSDIRIKKDIYDLAPSEVDNYSIETRIKYGDKLYEAIKDIQDELLIILNNFNLNEASSSINELFEAYKRSLLECNYDYNKIYSKREIKRLIANKDIVIINEKAKAIDNHTSFSKQKYEPMPSLNIDFSDGSNHISKFIYDNFKLFGELLRNIFTKRVVLNDIKDFLNELNEEIRIVFSGSKSKEFVHYVTASMCKEWYESSKEKEDIQNIQRKLSPSKKMRG